MYNDTITLFCRYEGKKKDVTWYPHVLHGVNLNMDAAAIVTKYGAESQDSVALNIRYTVEKGLKMVGGKQWLPPKEWRRQNDRMSETLTFTSGQEFDFFYAGEWGNESPVSDSDYGIDGFFDYMNAKYDYVYAITSVAQYSVIPHFEIMAK